MTIEKTEFTFPDEASDNPRKGGKVVEPAADDTGKAAAPDIEIVDDTPPADRNRKPMAEPPKDPTDEEMQKWDEGVKRRIQHFTKGYHEERRAKEAAQREKEEAIKIAQAVAEENKKLRGSLSEGHTALLEQAKLVAANEMADAERKYRAAYEAGDSAALVEAQRAISAATIKADRIANFKPESLQPAKTEVQLPQTQGTRPADPKLDDWKSRNEWFGANKRMTAYALGLHDELAEEGVQIGSDAYYQRLDADMKTRFPEQFAAEDTDSTGDAKPQQRSNVVAPATRSTAARKVVLTQSQVNIAKRLGVPLELYARKVAEEMRK